MSKILIGVNTLTAVEQDVYSNHCQFWYRLGRNTDHEFIFCAPRRMNIDNMRNMCANIAIAQDCDYILFIDDDVLVPFTALQQLIECNAGIAAGWTIIRGYPYRNMFFRWADVEHKNLETYPDPIPMGRILDCDAVGFSCCLISVDLLKKVEQPYFITGPFNTEDIYFCLKARVAEPDCKIVVDTGVITQHLLGPEFVGPMNVQYLKTYNESCEPEIVKNCIPAVETPEQQARKLGNLALPSYEALINQVLFNGPEVAVGVGILDS